MRAHGHVFKYGDNVDTDVIIPARYLNSFDAQELASHAMADIDPDFVKKVQSGDIIVANKNFGCGSSREHAPLCLKTAGVSCIIAETFARIFYRNAINIGLPIIECPEAAQGIEAGDEVEVDFDSGMIYNRTSPPEPPASEGGQVQVLRFFCPVSDWTAKSPASRQPPFGTWQAEMSRYKQHSPPAAQKNAPSSPCAELLAPKPRPGPLTGPVAPGTSVPVCTPCEPCLARFPA